MILEAGKFEPKESYDNRLFIFLILDFMNKLLDDFGSDFSDAAEKTNPWVFLSAES